MISLYLKWEKMKYSSKLFSHFYFFFLSPLSNTQLSSILSFLSNIRKRSAISS